MFKTNLPYRYNSGELQRSSGKQKFGPAKGRGSSESSVALKKIGYIQMIYTTAGLTGQKRKIEEPDWYESKTLNVFAIIRCSHYEYPINCVS